MWRALALGVFSIGCVESAVVKCDNGLSCPEGHTCDAIHGGCASPEQLAACAQSMDDAPCSAAVIGAGYCDAGVCMPSRCGDGIRAAEEICDGEQFATISTCDQVGFYSTNQLACSPTCELDSSACTGVCGDNTINGEELCDGTAVFPESCLDFGYGAGRLACAPTCGPELASCVPFGWHAIPMPEEVTALHGTSASNIWVVGRNKMIQRFDGSSWSSVDVSACATGSDLGPHVFVLSPTEAFVVDGDGILRITSGGCTRSTVGGGAYFNDLWASSIDNAYVISDDFGTTSIWGFNGTRWSLADSASGLSIALWGSGPSDVYATDASNQLRHYNGQNWSWLTVPDLTTGFSIWGTGPGDFYVAGGTTGNRAIVKHYTTVNGWSTVLSNLPVLGLTTEQSFAFDGATIGTRSFVMASVSNNGGAQRYLLLGSDGTGWVDLQAPLPFGGGLPYVAPDGIVYMRAHQQSRIFVYQGSTLLDTNIPVGLTPRLLHAAGANTAVAYDNYTDVMWGWDGATWAQESAPNEIHDVVATAGGEIFVVSTTTMGIRKRTGPGVFENVADIKGTLIAGSSGSDLWVYRNPNPTANTVAHWTGNTSVDETLPIINPTVLFSISPTVAFAGFSVGAVSTQAIARWDGNQWTAMTTPAGLSIVYGIFGVSASDVFAWSDSRIVHYDGVSWSPLNHPPGMTRVHSVWGTTGALFVAGNNGVYYNDGQGWTPVDSGDPFPVLSLSGRGDSLYIGGETSVRQLYRTRPW